jgi:hypothetical protein
VRYRRFAQYIALLLVGLVAGGPPAMAAGKTPEVAGAAPTIDVTLTDDGALRGLVADSSAAPVADVAVEARDARGAIVGSAITGADGEFSILGLKGGTYSVYTLGKANSCRAWKRQFAPPCARDRLLLVHDSATVRGQAPRRPILFLIPIAAATGVYIAVKEREDRPNGS